MQQLEVTVQNPVGLHARPAAACVKEAMRFGADISLVRGERRANAKSLFSVLALGAKQGDSVLVIAEGSDESEAVRALAARIEGQFDAV